MSEPDWKADLRDAVDFWVKGGESTKANAFESFLAHMEGAYDRGLMAGRSQSGYNTRRKKKEG